MKIKVSEATNLQLNWLVAKLEGREFEAAESFVTYHDNDGEMNYSTDHAQGQPILEREGISLMYQGEGDWDGDSDAKSGLSTIMSGPTMLIAGLRCFIVSKLGDEVEVPDVLT